MSRSTRSLYRSALAAGATTPQQILDFHRATFGATRMADEDGADKDSDADKDAEKDDDTDNGDEAQLGDAGKKALDRMKADRKAANERATAAEKKVNDLFEALKTGLGIETKEADVSEVVGGLQKQLNDLQHQTLVDSVARSHGITEDDDIELLRSAKDKDVMEKLAARLKPSDEEKDGKDGKRPGGRPRADSSQGRSGTSGGGTASVSTGRDLYGERHGKKS